MPFLEEGVSSSHWKRYVRAQVNALILTRKPPIPMVSTSGFVSAVFDVSDPTSVRYCLGKRTDQQLNHEGVADQSNDFIYFPYKAG